MKANKNYKLNVLDYYSKELHKDNIRANNDANNEKPKYVNNSTKINK